jgi:hypothetical protein
LVRKKSVEKKVLVDKDTKPAKTVSMTQTKPELSVTSPVAMVPAIKKHTLYVEVSPEKYFILCDGRKIKSGKELADILQLINDDMFKYHVTETKNDFSNWINDVFGERDLAKKIHTVRNRLEMSIELYRAMFDKLDSLSKK